MYWIFVYKYNGPYSFRGFKEVIKILCKLQKVKGLEETVREWNEDTEDWAEVKEVSLSTMEVRKRTEISTRVVALGIESRKNGPRKIDHRKNGPRKIGPRKNCPGKLRNKKSWGKCRASWCVCGMFRCDQSMKTQNSTTNLPGLL